MLNVIVLHGRLTKDPVFTRTNNGSSVVNFDIAVTGRPQGNGEKEVLFMPCSVFGTQADVVAKHFHKGMPIAVYGRLTCRKYTSKQGVQVTAYTVQCDRIEFIDYGSQEATHEEASVKEMSNTKNLDVGDEDLPF